VPPCAVPCGPVPRGLVPYWSRWPRSTSGKKRSAAPPPGAVTGEEHAETAYAVAASRPDPARGAASDGVLHSCQLSELPRIGVLLEAGDLAVRKVPNVRDLRIERLTGGFCGCCLVSSLNYNYIATRKNATNVTWAQLAGLSLLTPGPAPAVERQLRIPPATGRKDHDGGCPLIVVLGFAIVPRVAST
jgi:hypothetical protein